MGATTMWILSYCLVVLLALGACDVATAFAYSPGSNGGLSGPNKPSQSTIYSAAVKGGFDTINYSTQAGSSGILMTGSDSSTRSQPQGSGVDSTGSGSLIYGTVGNAVSVGMSGYDVSPSTNVQGSEVISSSVLMPLQQSSYSVSKPVLLTAQLQSVPHSNSQQPASSGTMAQSSPLQLPQSSGQQLPQPSSLSSVHAGRRPHKPLKGKPHQSGSNIVLGSRPVQNPVINTLKPLKTIFEYGSVPSSLAVASYELVGQSSGQTVNQPSGVQPPDVVDLSVVQPSSQLQQAVDTSVAQASSQQLVQTSQFISQSNDRQPVHGSSVFTAQPSGLTHKPHKGRHPFGSRFPSSTSTLHTPGSSFVVQSASQIPVQTSYQSGTQPALQFPVQVSYKSEAQSASQKPGQTSFLSVPQIVKPAQISYQSVAQPIAQASYESVSLSNGPQLVQAAYQSNAQPGPISYQFVAEPSIQQPAKVSFSVAQPISQQAGPSTYEYVVEQSGQPHFQPVHSHGVHQIGSKLFSCQELPQHGYHRRFHSPPRTSLSALTLHTKPVVQYSDQAPVKPNHRRPLTSTLQSILTPAHVLSSQESLSLPSYTPQALLVDPLYQPLAQSSSETISLAEYQISPVPGQFVSQPQMLPSSQSSSSSGMSVQSSYQPLVLSSYETVLQPGFQTSSVLVPSSYQSMGSQELSHPVVSNHESVFQSVQPELAIPLQVDYQSVTGQNAPGLAQNDSSQKLFRLLQQVKS